MLFKILILFFVTAGCFAFPTLEDEAYYDQRFIFTNSNERIVGGTVAADGSATHMVMLSRGDVIRSLVCGGSLISTRHVLTAAHCIVAVYSGEQLSSTLRLVVGTNNFARGGQMYEVSHNYTHAEYDSRDIKYDIGLLVTKLDIPLSRMVSPVPLSFDHVPGAVPVRATGWGRTAAGGSVSEDLLEVHLSTLGGEECVQAVRDFGSNALINPEIELCTYHSPGYGVCNGDSGSALTLLDNNQQVGIVSWGFACARGAPDMFVRVEAFRSWLRERTSILIP